MRCCAAGTNDSIIAVQILYNSVYKKQSKRLVVTIFASLCHHTRAFNLYSAFNSCFKARHHFPFIEVDMLLKPKAEWALVSKRNFVTGDYLHFVSSTANLFCSFSIKLPSMSVLFKKSKQTQLITMAIT